jgi:hypothetical protein
MVGKIHHFFKENTFSLKMPFCNKTNQMKSHLILILAILTCFFTSAQTDTDTILVYDVNSHTTGIILPVSFNPLITSDHSSSSMGTMGGLPASLPQTPPTSNTFSNSSFSKLAHASSFFTLTDYPVRTVINLRTYVDTNTYIGTGMMVGPCFVLTSAVNIHNFGTHSFWAFDSLRIIPAFDNGHPQPGLPSSRVQKIYKFKSFDPALDDIALLQLEDPVGQQIGWTGIGFDDTPNFTSGKVYHKFSYPSQVAYFDSSKVYNGDTLYYNYGSIVDQPGPYLEIQSNEALALPGQGGSTFLYKDNGNYYSVGLSTWSIWYRHYRITNKAFYQMQNVLMTQTCLKTTALNEEDLKNVTPRLYPNPVLNEATLEFDYDPSLHYSLKILSLLGQQIGEAIPVDSGTIRISSDDLSSGVYFLHLQAGKRSAVCKMVVEK